VGTVTPRGPHEVGTIVEQERHAARAGNRAERIDRTLPSIIVGVLQSELNGGDVARVERLPQQGGNVCRSNRSGVMT